MKHLPNELKWYHKIKNKNRKKLLKNKKKCLKHVETGFTSIKMKNLGVFFFAPSGKKRRPPTPPPPPRMRVWARIALQKQLSLGGVDAAWKGPKMVNGASK